MNQTPNTEEAVPLIVEMKVHGDAELEEDVRTVLHHQLQKAYEQGVQDELNRESQNMDAVIAGMIKKARHNWLREEIVKLEQMKKSGYFPEHDKTNQFLIGYNQALQTIIDRYHSELDQPNK